MAEKNAVKTRKAQIKEKNLAVTKKTKPVDFILVITVLLLLALGIIMVLSASSPAALAEYGNSYAFVTRQGLSACIGLTLMVIISRIDYHKYKPLYKIAYFGSVGLLALVPIMGSDANGAKRWIDLGPLRFISTIRNRQNWTYSFFCCILSRA